MREDISPTKPIHMHSTINQHNKEKHINSYLQQSIDSSIMN